MKLKKLLLSSLAFTVIAGCQANADHDIEIEMKTLQEQQELLDAYTYDDYKNLYEKVFAQAEDFKETDAELKKWIIRELASEALLYETDLTADQILEGAKRNMKEDEAWKQIAREEYGVSITEEEVDAYIQEGPDTSSLPQHLALADALGMSLQELNHVYDRDIYIRNAMWQKLKPVLEKEYGATDHNELVEKYNEEVKNELNR